MKIVSVINTHLNPVNLTPVLESLSAVHTAKFSHQIIVFENGIEESKKGDYQAKFPQVTFINSGKFIGCSLGLNMGISEALKNQADFIWLSDPTILPAVDMFEYLLQAAEKYRDCLLFTPKIYISPDSKIISSAGYTTDWTNLKFIPRGHGEPDGPIYDRDVEIDYIPINQLFVRSKTWSEFGLFDTRYFINYFDMALYQKIRSRGYHHNFISLSHAGINGNLPGLSASADTYYKLRDKTYFSLLYAPVTTKYSALKIAFNKYFHGSPWERRAILDVFSGNLGSGSYQWE